MLTQTVLNMIKSLQAQNSIHNFDVFCLLETFLDTTIQFDDPDYTSVGNDDKNNVKKIRVCIYYKRFPLLRVRNISRINKCLILEMKLNGKSVILATLYRSSS